MGGNDHQEYPDDQDKKPQITNSMRKFGRKFTITSHITMRCAGIHRCARFMISATLYDFW